MRFWDKSLQICTCRCDHGRQGVRRMAPQTGLSKRRVERRQHAMARRHSHPASWGWATAAGRHWLRRLVVAPRYPVGRKRGVGLETRREVCARLPLERPVGWSPSAWRRVMPAWEAARRERAAAWAQEGGASGAVREVLGAVEATCWERLVLVCLARATGSLRREAVADDRPSPTGKAVVEERRKGLGTGVRSGVRDRAHARIQRAAQGLACLRRPACFPVAHALVPR